MIRKFFLIAIPLAFTAQSYGQSMKVVVDSTGIVVGRYVSANDSTFTVGVQDIFDVPKAGLRVVKYRAKDGRGVVWCKASGTVCVYDRPSDSGAVIGHLVSEEDCVPDTYPCLGKRRGWYKVRVNGLTGYVRVSRVLWDALDTL